ncbi:hypothetical protein GO281_03759 [Ralstonia solanacearum]|nr:hypothetical protein [Ralstonia solanacearum]NKF72990.1 hypothetical protein [Ralstonia solanacearum]
MAVIWSNKRQLRLFGRAIWKLSDSQSGEYSVPTSNTFASTTQKEEDDGRLRGIR